jgi:protein TonB
MPVAAMPASPGTGTDVREQLLARAENALLEERLDEAAQAIEAARKAGVPSARIAFLSTQLSRARERAKVAAAQARLRAEVPGAARTAAATPIPPAVTTTPAEAQAGSAVAESPTGGAPADAAASTRQTAIPPAERSAALAMARIQEDRLIDPQDDSARFYVLEAQKQDRGSAAVEEAEQALALKLLDAAHAAIDRRDFTRASSWLDAAVGIAAPANIENLRRAQDSARALAAGEAADHLLKSAQERLAEDHLIEPEEDSAAYYLRTLRSVDPRNPALSGLTQEVGSRLIAKARSALTLQQYEAARSWLDQASTIGYSAPDAEAARQDLAAAQNRKPAETAVRNAAELDLMKSVPPTYPVAAEKSSTEGWVELDFTVTESGGVKDVTVHAAKPTGVFEQAATAALLQWQYRPVMQDSKPVAQRARIRIRFALSR